MKFSEVIFLIVLFIKVSKIDAIEISCKFEDMTPLDREEYRCTESSIRSFTKNITIEKINGDHIENFNNVNVTGFRIVNGGVNGMMQFMVKGFDKFFPNIELVAISSVNLYEINSDDLKQFPKMNMLLVENNEIQIIRADLFDHNPRLEIVNLNGNRIAHIAHDFHEHLLIYNKHLNYILLYDNECVRKEIRYQIIQNYPPDYLTKCLFPNEIYCIIKANVTCELHSNPEYSEINKDVLIITPETIDPNNVTKVVTITPNSATFYQIPVILGQKFPYLTDLILTSQITHFSRKTMKEFPNLKVLTLQGNEIRILNFDIFWFNPKLEQIDLSQNLIDVIDDGTFDGLNNLKYLNLANNICLKDSSDHTALTSFDVKKLIENTITKKCSHDFLKQILCNFGKSTFRYVGTIYYCELTIHTDPFVSYSYDLIYFTLISGGHKENKSNKDIQGLITKSNNIKNIIPRADLLNLKLMKVTHSKLQCIDPETFNGMNDLQVVDLSHNELNEIPKDLFATNLKLMFVDFSFNQLKRIVFKSEMFKNLVGIKLIENQELNENLIFNQNINGIEITCNHDSLYEYKCFPSNLKQITEIYNVSDVTAFTDQNTTKTPAEIIEIYLEFPVMYYLPNNLGEFFKNLQKFSADQRIKEIYRENFRTLTNLIYLDLSGNQIQFITDSDIFVDCKKLEKIKLSRNGMKSIASDTFNQLPSLKEIFLINNDCASVILTKEDYIQSDRFKKFLYLTDLCGAKLEYFFRIYQID